MGAAAYNRGSKLVKDQLTANQRATEFAMMDHLNSLPKYGDAGKPFDIIRFAFSHGVWWAECPKTGFGYHYKTLREAVKRWCVEIIGYENGEWIAKPNP